jgi:hypothetical protein
MNSEALLTGRIFDDRGNRMSPSHVTRRTDEGTKTQTFGRLSNTSAGLESSLINHKVWGQIQDKVRGGFVQP